MPSARSLIKAAVAVLALCLLASALAPDLTVLFISRVLGGVAAGGIMPVCMALIGDSFPLAVRQVALSRYIGATLVGQLVGASVGGEPRRVSRRPLGLGQAARGWTSAWPSTSA